MVGNDFLGEAMEFPDIAEVQVGCAGGRDGGHCFDEMRSFAYRVNNYHDSIVSSGIGQLDDEIHTDGVPAVLWNRERLQFPNRRVSLCLGPEAEVASGDVSADVSGHVWPPVVPGDKFQGLKSTRMPC